MPIFHIEIHSDQDPPEGLAKSLADDLGTLLEAEPGHVWVRLSSCPRQLYAENQMAEAPPWVFARVILRRLPDEATLAARAESITALLAKHTRRPREDIHLYFDPPAAGRIAFGGELVRSGG